MIYKQVEEKVETSVNLGPDPVQSLTLMEGSLFWILIEVCFPKSKLLYLFIYLFSSAVGRCFQREKVNGGEPLCAVTVCWSCCNSQRVDLGFRQHVQQHLPNGHVSFISVFKLTDVLSTEMRVFSSF